MESTAKCITDLLEGDSSLGLSFGENLFIGREPSLPKQLVVIWGTPGAPPQMTMDGKDIYRDSFQVMIRTLDYETGFSQAYDIRDYLHGINHQVAGDRRVLLIRLENGPFPLEWAENILKIVMNFEITYTLTV